VIQLKILPRFPSSVTAASPVLLDKTGGNFAFSLDVNALAASLSSLFQPIENIDQEITAGATANINTTSNTVRVNKTVGGVITLTLPPSAFKISAVLVADWKGDAGTNNITILPTGTEKIQGLSSWTIAADNGSVFLRPIAGIGYVI
jgi:hypothetical protein